MDEETPRFVLKRSGESVLFEVDKIRRAIYLCLVNSCQMQDEAEVFTIVDNVLDVALPAIETLPAPISVETIQDQVEEAMMVLGHRKEARQYILYRERHRQAREDIPDDSEGTHIPFVRHVAQEWVTRALDLSATYAPREMEGLDLEDFVTRVVRQSYEGISAEQVWELTILTARSQVEWDLRFDALARNLLLLHVEDETGVYSDQDSNVFAQRLHEGVEGGRYDKRLIDGRFDLDRLASALDRNRDMKFGYAGLKDLTDRYLRRQFDHKLLEVPQSFWMRVAMGLSILEDEPTERALQFYELMSTFRYVPSTPTLFNGGTVHMQLASCFLTSVDDSLSGIFKSVGDNAMMSKWAGGLGTDLTNLRASGSLVKGTGGRSKGPVPFMKVFNSQSVAVTQGEIRKGAATMWLAVWHRDIQDFLDSHLRQGDDRMRCHDINIGVWIDDLFMKRYEADEEYTLFCPGSVPGLHDAYGEEFERLYEEYEAKAFRGEIEDFTVVRAKDLYRLILTRCNQGGEPFIGFKDAANLRNPQAHDGVIHSSNLCTEITLNTGPSKLVQETISDDGTSYSREYKAGDVGVCVLGSVNLAAHVVHNPLDGALINFPLLRDTVHTAIRMLDNVIDLGFYPTSEARISCQRHRAVALGQMGFQDILWDMRLTYDSWAAVELASEISEAICHAAVDASAELARERGTYDTYEGSTWSQGLMPQDTLAKLLANRGQTDDWDYASRYDWDAVRAKVKEVGVRNSNLLAIAPTASISKLINVRQGIDPQYWHAYTRTAMGGDFTTVTKPLVDELRARGLWTREVLNEIKVSRAGTTVELSIPEDLKARFVTAFDIDQIWLVRCAAARQRWIDQGQSLNIYMDKPKGAQIVAVYTEAWKLGLKTLYYLRSLGKNTAEKSTVTAATPVAEVPDQEVVVLASCDPNNPDCEACQ